jgi:hypothetical protein
MFNNLGVYDVLVEYLNISKNNETKRNLYEALTLITLSRTKLKSIENIINADTFARAA